MKNVVCSTPRSGSTAIAQMLAETRSHTDKFIEYENPGYMVKSYGHLAINAVHECRNDERTGLKVMWEHFNTHAQKATLEALNVYFVIRRNIVAQAVSMYFAIATGFWYPDDRFDPGKVPEYSYSLIRLFVDRIMLHNFQWDLWFYRNGVTPTVIYYEDHENSLSGQRHPGSDIKDLYTSKFMAEFSERTSMSWSEFCKHKGIL